MMLGFVRKSKYEEDLRLIRTMILNGDNFIQKFAFDLDTNHLKDYHSKQRKK